MLTLKYTNNLDKTAHFKAMQNHWWIKKVRWRKNFFPFVQYFLTNKDIYVPPTSISLHIYTHISILQYKLLINFITPNSLL